MKYILIIIYIFLASKVGYCTPSQFDLHNCLSEKISEYSDLSILLIRDDNNSHIPFEKITSTKVIYNKDNFRSKKLNQYGLIVLEVNTIHEFYQILDVIISNNATFRPRSKFLIVYFGSSDLAEFFHHSWRYFIVNIAVLSTDGTVHTYFPYHQRRCGRVIIPEVLGTCGNISDMFPNKIPLDLGGCEVKFMPYPMIPYVINVSKNRKEPSKSGLEVTIVSALAEKMNFKETYVVCPHPFWGFKEAGTGEYTFMFGSLFQNETDILMGMTYGNASHTVDFDGSYVYLLDRSVWWVPTASPIAQWKNLTVIFEGRLWLAILIILIINGFSWWFIGRKREDDKLFNDLVLCLMASLYTLLQGSVVAPRKWNLRMVFIIWLIADLLLFTAHQSSLVSILTTPLYDHQISTLEEVVASSLTLSYYVGARAGYQDSDHWLSKIIYNNFYQCPLSLYCMNKTAFDRTFAYLRNLRNSKYFIPRLYTLPNGREMVYQLEGYGVGIWVRFHTRKGLPFLDRINELLMLLQANGLVSKWDKEASYKRLQLESEDANEALTIGHLQGAFFILIIGLMFSLFVLGWEVVIGRKCWRRKENVLQYLK